MIQYCLLLFSLAISTCFAKASQPKILSDSPRVYWIDHFLSDKECDYLISLSEPFLSRSTVLDDTYSGDTGLIDYRRTSQGMFITSDLSDKTVRKIEKRIAELTRYPVANGESIQVLRYQKGGEYRPHFDFFNYGTPGGASSLARGGQRMITVIMYLKSPKKGGETIFPRLNLSVAPQKGGALIFHNCLDNGMEDELTLHGGALVLEGEKWIATKWIRAGVFN